MDAVRHLVAEIPNFPKPGVLFRDLTPVLQNAEAFARIVSVLTERYRGQGITQVVGIESRGFIFGAAVAHALNLGFVPIRKLGKLPRATFSVSYDLEYGQDTLQIHQDALSAKDRILLVDDLLATGGTARAAAALVKLTGATIHELAVVVELSALRGRASLAGLHLHSLLAY